LESQWLNPIAVGFVVNKQSVLILRAKFDVGYVEIDATRKDQVDNIFGRYVSLGDLPIEFLEINLLNFLDVNARGIAGRL
jgi:hypothetical protein